MLLTYIKSSKYIVKLYHTRRDQKIIIRNHYIYFLQKERKTFMKEIVNFDELLFEVFFKKIISI